MVYNEVLVAASVVAVLAMARKTGAAEWPSGPAGLPIDEADLISGDETGPSDSWKSNAERAQTSPCDQNGGMCIKKKDVRSCNGNIEEKYKCPTRKYRCCINDTIGNRIQEILMLLNNVINSNSEMEMELSQVKENQESLLANVTNSNSQIAMELSQVKDNQETLFSNVTNSNSEIAMELSQVKDNQETLLSNVINSNSDISMELSQLKDNQANLLSNVTKYNSEISIELNQVKDNQETLLSNVTKYNSEISIELNQVKDNQETLLSNVTKYNSEISIELNQVKDNQEILLSNVTNSNSEIVMKLKKIEDNVDFIITLLAMPSTTTASTTTMAPTTTAIEIPVPVPSGFEKLEDGRVIRRTVSSDPKNNSYDTQMDFCDQYGAKPFIPRTQADYLLYKEVRESLGIGGYMWLPANDKQEEGTLRWFNGEVASNTLFRWRNGQELIHNTASRDCVIYACCSNDDDGVRGPDVHLYPCNAVSSYPPICEII